MKTKTFDCVEMKRRGAKRIVKELEGKTFEEKLKYWRNGTEKLRKLQKDKKG